MPGTIVIKIDNSNCNYNSINEIIKTAILDENTGIVFELEIYCFSILVYSHSGDFFLNAVYNIDFNKNLNLNDFKFDWYKYCVVTESTTSVKPSINIDIVLQIIKDLQRISKLKTFN